jgi:hypothetical protein
MSAIEPGDVYVKAEGHEFNQVPDGYVIYQTARDRVHFLNPTAVIVYELCDGKNTIEQIGRFIRNPTPFRLLRQRRSRPASRTS